MNKLFLIVFLGLIAESYQFTARGGVRRLPKYRVNIVPDYEHLVPKYKMDCANNILYDYHHEHPKSTRFLLQFRDVRSFLMDIFHHCNTLPMKMQDECRDTWKQSVADELNELFEDAVEYDPDNGEKWLADIIIRSVDCLTIGKEFKSYDMSNSITNMN